MKKGLILLSIIVLGITNLLAQSLTAVDWGTYNTVPEETSYLNFVGASDDAYYFIHSDKKVRINPNKVWLDKFSSMNNALETSSLIELPLIQKKKTKYEALFFQEGKWILFSSLIDNSRKQKVLYVSYLNENGTLKNKPMEIDAVPLGRGIGGLEISLSKDGTGIVVLAYQPFVKYKGGEFHVSLIDYSLMKMSEFVFTFPEEYNDKTVRIKQFDYTKKGDIVFLTEVEKLSTKKPRKGQEIVMKFKHVLMVFNAEQEVLKDFVVSAAKYVIDDARFTVNKNNIIVLGGMIRGKDADSRMGFFYKRYDPSKLKALPDVDPKSFIQKFGREILAELALPTFGKTKKERYAYRVNSIEELANGTYIILTEQFYRTSKQVKGPEGKINMYYYYHGNILAAGIGKTGRFDWIKNYHKKQKATNDDAFHSSYALVKIKNKLKLFYNDNSSNLEKGIDPKKVKEFKTNIRTNPKGIATVLSVYRDGSYEIDPMFPEAEDGLVILPQTIGVKKETHVVIAQSGKEYKLGSFIVE